VTKDGGAVGEYNNIKEGDTSNTYFVHTWDLFPCHQYNIFNDVETETALFNTMFVSVLRKIYGAERHHKKQ
jgi:hypothetical protein